MKVLLNGGWGQGGCEPRIEVIVKFEEKKVWRGSSRGGLMGGPVVGRMGGCERRIEVIVKMRKKSGKGGVRGWSGEGVGWR